MSDGNHEPGPAATAPCILIVEDEMLVAMMLEDMLADLGLRSMKAARIGKAALLASEAALAGAILDVNVAGETVYPVARELRRRRIPFVFATGYGVSGLRADYRDWPTLSKPFHFDALQRVVGAWTGPAAAG